MFQERNLDWFPRMRAMSLAAEENDAEQNDYRTLQIQLNSTTELVQLLTTQLNDLKVQTYFQHQAWQLQSWPF